MLNTSPRAMIIQLLLALGCAAVFATSTHAQSVMTDPVGFTTASLLGESDSAISLPFVRPAEFVGGISAASGNTITVSGSTWTANQFVYNGGQLAARTRRKDTPIRSPRVARTPSRLISVRIT
jgi:hypothetical protein